MKFSRTAILFPAYVPELTGKEPDALKGHEKKFKARLDDASGLLGMDLTMFDFHTNDFTDDEEKSQYISYIFSCTVADILKEKDVRPSYVSGYSMGLYAALYYCRALTFEDGLMLVKRAWDQISDVIGKEKYGMGMIIGLSETDVLKLIGAGTGVIICNQNNPHTCIISGNLYRIEQVLALAKNEGALKFSLLPVSKPYHTEILKEAIPGFEKFLDQTAVRDPSCAYLSSLNQEIIRSGEGLRGELIRNLYSRMNWFETMKTLIGHGTDVFFECGAGDGLTKNFRFIDKKVKALSSDKIDGLFL